MAKDKDYPVVIDSDAMESKVHGDDEVNLGNQVVMDAVLSPFLKPKMWRLYRIDLFAVHEDADGFPFISREAYETEFKSFRVRGDAAMVDFVEALNKDAGKQYKVCVSDAIKVSDTADGALYYFSYSKKDKITGETITEEYYMGTGEPPWHDAGHIESMEDFKTLPAKVVKAIEECRDYASIANKY